MSDVPAEEIAPEPVVLQPPPYQADCCYRGHSFEARYSTVPPDASEIAELGRLDSNYWDEDEVCQVVESMTKRTYVCDVCVRCGLTAGIV